MVKPETNTPITITRQIMDAWEASTEATLKATFELQNAMIASGRTLIESTGNENLKFMQQWADMVHQAQKSTFDAWEISKQAAEKMMVMPGTK